MNLIEIFRKWKKKYFQFELNEHETKSKRRKINYLYEIIYEFKRGCQSRNCLIKHNVNHMHENFHKILNRWMNSVSHFSIVYKVGRVRY
jgi:hypothetical protein